jgi:GH18 family chitinase
LSRLTPNLTEIDQSMKLLWRNGINPSKVVLGLGFYGRSYALADPSCNTAGCPFISGAPAGPCRNSVGTLSYGEIQRLIEAGAQPVLDEKAAVQTLTYGGNNWVSYDDETTLRMKVDYANNNCLGGTMVWAASTDDSKDSAATALAAASGISIGPKGTRVGLVVPRTTLVCVRGQPAAGAAQTE